MGALLRDWTGGVAAGVALGLFTFGFVMAGVFLVAAP